MLAPEGHSNLGAAGLPLTHHGRFEVLRVDDELASRMHAVIEVAGPEDITLIDLGNEPGTMVNGARVNKCKLHVGDQIQVGETKIVLESAEPAGAEAQAAAGHRGPSAPYAAPPPNPFGAAPSAGYAPAPAPFAAAANPFASAPVNPFGGHADPMAVPDDAPPGTYTYTMIKSGPDVSPDEVELPYVQAVEVMVLWGTNVLHVSHLTPPRSFYVGEEQGSVRHGDIAIRDGDLGVRAEQFSALTRDPGLMVFVTDGAARGERAIERATARSDKRDFVDDKGRPCQRLLTRHCRLQHDGSAWPHEFQRRRQPGF